jgi:hypothetical protein
MVKLWPPRGHGRRMRILLLDADMAIDDADWSTFESTQSLYDYDLVLWDPFRSMKPYPKRGYGAGSSNGLVRLRNDIARRQLDFAKFLKLVRTIVTFLPSDVTVYVDSGERQHSGTGRSRQTSAVVTRVNILDSLRDSVKRPTKGR